MNVRCHVDLSQAERDQLSLQLIEGDMADLSALASERFDIVFHPVSNCFAPEIRPVWKEAFRVLRPGGRLLAGVDPDAAEVVAEPVLHERALGGS